MIGEFQRALKAADPAIPFTILAFFPEHKMKFFGSPTAKEMVNAYQKAKAAGLKNIRLGNLGVFIRTEEDQKYLLSNVDSNAF